MSYFSHSLCHRHRTDAICLDRMGDEKKIDLWNVSRLKGVTVLAVLVSLWKKYQLIESVGIMQVTHILTMDTLGGPSLATKGRPLEEFQYMDVVEPFRT